MKKVLPTAVAVTLVASAGLAAYRSGWLANYLPLRAAVSEAQVVEISTRGPGMRRQSPDSLSLPVPRTFEMTHVDSTHFAVALGKDPVRIFEFVRDQIAYEVYIGCLRGPRGTLMAMAGNSVDRAALLASMLQHAGQRVRYVRGTLPEREAKELVTSMWAERPRVAKPKVEGEPSPALKVALDTLEAGVKRDYTLIREHLKKANITPSPESAPALDSLVKEAQAHYWVQWWKDNAWVDLDPSFGDAAPGRNYAPLEKTFDVLPEALFHRVEIRVRLEEYTGDKPSSRVILTYTAKAADLSGVDLMLSHQPENWKGPATSIASALSSAIESTGRVKPVLLLGGQDWRTGEPFRQKPPTGAGIGGITDLLGGAGTRKPVPVATAETIEFDFISPGGRKETVVREIFDVVGKARRAAGRNLSAAEVGERSKNEPDVTRAVYDLFFTTGRVDAAHLSKLVEVTSADQVRPDVREVLGRVNIMFAATSDALVARVGQSPQTGTLFYPDSPRVHIAELAELTGKLRISLDLRRDRARAVGIGSRPEDVSSARIFRGIIDSTLERVLIEYLGASLREKNPWTHAISTSSLFEQALAQNVKIVLLGQGDSLASEVPEDARVRANEDVAAGYLVLTLQRAIAIDGGLRLAWWRIDPRSGETIGVTDEGLHAAEYQVKIVRGMQGGRIGYYVIVLSPGVGAAVEHLSLFFLRYERALEWFLHLRLP